jgi:hypothetical protein
MGESEKLPPRTGKKHAPTAEPEGVLLLAMLRRRN